MTSAIHLPAALRASVGGQRLVPTGGLTVGLALDELKDSQPQLERRIRDEQGQVRQHIRIYLGDTDIESLAGLKTRLSEGAQIYIIPAVSGGCAGRSQS
ncbi:MAG: ubiquitin-like small modifier protein 1 [Candidatus Dormibacteria bacterium]